jgi:hypothetical protein
VFLLALGQLVYLKKSSNFYKMWENRVEYGEGGIIEAE